jgi:hypothetical protein
LRILIGILTGAGILCAQIPTSVALEDPSVLRAKFNVDRVRALVESGALPRVKLEKAEADLKDIQDESYITRALYGKDLTTEQAAGVVEAAQRRLDRRKESAEAQQKLLASGIIAQSEMKSAMDEMDRSTKELEWAVARQKLVAEVAHMALAEEEFMRQLEAGAIVPGPGKLVERYDGKGTFTATDFGKVQTAFMMRFSKALPVSAAGETAVHRSMGFDHSNRFDIAVTPDSPEGVWLRRFLTVNRMPFFAFRTAVARQATGAHVHMGPPSTRYVHVQARTAVSGSSY